MIDLSCAQCRERLPFSVAGQLASAERAEVARHLATCASCRAVLRQWMVIQQALRLDDAGAPPDTSAEQVWEGIWRRLPNTPREIGAWRNARSPQLTTIEREDEEMQPDEIDARQAGSSVATRPAQKRTRRRTLLLTLTSLAAVAAVVVALVGVFGATLRSRTATQPMSCAASQYRATLPSYTTFKSISMATPNEGWAIGGIEQVSQAQTQPELPLMAHLQNCQWKAVSLPVANLALDTIAMTGPNDGWSFGVTSSNSGTTTPLLVGLQYQHGRWRTAPLPKSMIYNTFALTQRMFSAHDGWLLAATYSDEAHVVLHYRLFHYNGVRWTEVILPFNNTSLQSNTTAIWGIASAAPNDCWLVATTSTGAQSSFNLVAHLTDGTWSIQAHFGLNNGMIHFDSMSFDSPTDGYLMGEQYYDEVVNGSTRTVMRPIIEHYHQGVWTGIAPFSVRLENLQMINCFAVAPDNVWALGIETNQVVTPDKYSYTLVAHYHHGRWNVVRDGYAGGYGVAVTSDALSPFAQEFAWTTVIRFIQLPFGYGLRPVNELALVENGRILVIPGQSS